jgi:TetR/AcrR family transcriptional regulator, fatty acid biosynthesis regulator
MGIRAQQKERTRRSLVDAAFNQLSAEHGFSNLSLREVAREAGIAPTSFYRHFKDMNELGLTMVDEGGLMLRQLMRKARQRIKDGGSVIRVSTDTFMEFVEQCPNVFRLLLQERSGNSAAFRKAVNREIRHFVEELTDYLIHNTELDKTLATIQCEAMLIIVFNAGAEALDMSLKARNELAERVIVQLNMIASGSFLMHKNNNMES